MAQRAALFVVTANLTDDGSVAYMKADKTWTPRLSEAAVLEGKGAVDEWLEVATTQERAVCDPYAMKVGLQDGRAVPLSARERIRSDGPTTRLRRPDPLARAS